MKNLLVVVIVLLSFSASAQSFTANVTQHCGFTAPIVVKQNVDVKLLPYTILIPALDLVLCDLTSESWIGENGTLFTVYINDSPTFKAKSSIYEGQLRMTIDLDGCLILVE
jgi:hypothetical protein